MVQLFKKYITSNKNNKDDARREFILNILLIGAIILSLVAFGSRLYDILTNGTPESGISLEILGCFVFFFFFLYYLSRKGKAKLISYLLIIILLLPTMYTSYAWGAEVPQGILLYALVIVIAGILINSNAGFVITFVSTVYLLVITHLQIHNISTPLLYWKTQKVTMGDTVLIDITLLIIGIVAWLFNLEIERALKRARDSENALRKERDNLEVTVTKRTRALRIAQMEKIAQLERFAEFGRVSSGLIHDLATPLNLVSLNLDRMRQLGKKSNTEHFEGSDVLLKRALIGIKRLESFVIAARRQVQYHEIKELFSLRSEITKLLQVLTYSAKEHNIAIVFTAEKNIQTYGNPSKFNQIVTNLVVNAIDSYDKVPAKTKRQIRIHISQAHNNAQLEVTDFGSGIPKKNLPYIFQPFFTTKKTEKGIGIGLSICKEIVENNFGGVISATSNTKDGTTFIVTFPIIKKSVNKKK